MEYEAIYLASDKPDINLSAGPIGPKHLVMSVDIRQSATSEVGFVFIIPSSIQIDFFQYIQVLPSRFGLYHTPVCRITIQCDTALVITLSVSALH